MKYPLLHIDDVLVPTHSHRQGRKNGGWLCGFRHFCFFDMIVFAPLLVLLCFPIRMKSGLFGR